MTHLDRVDQAGPQHFTLFRSAFAVFHDGVQNWNLDASGNLWPIRYRRDALVLSDGGDHGGAGGFLECL